MNLSVCSRSGVCFWECSIPYRHRQWNLSVALFVMNRARTRPSESEFVLDLVCVSGNAVFPRDIISGTFLCFRSGVCLSKCYYR